MISSPRRLSDKYLVVAEQAAVPVVGLRLRLSLDIYSICEWHDFSFPHSRYYNLSRRSLDKWFTCAVPDESCRWRALPKRAQQYSTSSWHVFIRFRKSFPIIVRREVVLVVVALPPLPPVFRRPLVTGSGTPGSGCRWHHTPTAQQVLD